jgi:hypothetical protein
MCGYVEADLGRGPQFGPMLVMTDKQLAQLIVPPITALIWLLASSQILKLARPGGELARNRSNLNWYSTGVVLLVMYFVWFHAELRSYRLSWGIVFLAVTLAIVLAERLSRDPSRGPRPAWRTILSFWIVANAAGLMVLSIFWYFGN